MLMRDVRASLWLCIPPLRNLKHRVSVSSEGVHDILVSSTRVPRRGSYPVMASNAFLYYNAMLHMLSMVTDIACSLFA